MTRVNLSVLTIAEIQRYVKEAEWSDALVDALRADPRQGVRRLADRGERSLAAARQRVDHFAAMLEYEHRYWDTGILRVAGVDEAGRGPLAGPVVAAAVIMGRNLCLPGLNDSKQLTEAEREAFYREIVAGVDAYGIGIVDHREIDRINILQASFQAMRLALDELAAKEVPPEMVLVDGDKMIPDMPTPQLAIVEGDAKSISIAAASIIAKVTRDRMMVELGKQYPGYGLERNKGYSAPEHLMGLRRLGPSPIHRLTFAPVRQSTYSALFHEWADGMLAAADPACFREMGLQLGRLQQSLPGQEWEDLLQLYGKLDKKWRVKEQEQEPVKQSGQGIRMFT